MTYANVESRYSARITLFLVALNGIEILAGVVDSMYLNTTTSEKNYYKAGLEWSQYMHRCICVITRVLNVIEYLDHAWKTHIRVSKI